MNLKALKSMIISLREAVGDAKSALTKKEKEYAWLKSTEISSGHYIINIPSVYAKLKDIIANSMKHLPDNREYLTTSWNQWEEGTESDKDSLTLSQATRAVAILDYIMELIEVETKSQKQKSQRKFFASAQEKLREAESSFDKKDYPSMMGTLNTALELALKELLDIPLTISRINTASIIEIWVKNKYPHSLYLSEARKHVLDVDNKIKHEGYTPKDCVDAMRSIEDLFKKLKGLKLTDNMKAKLYEGLNVK